MTGSYLINAAIAGGALGAIVALPRAILMLRRYGQWLDGEFDYALGQAGYRHLADHLTARDGRRVVILRRGNVVMGRMTPKEAKGLIK